MVNFNHSALSVEQLMHWCNSLEGVSAEVIAPVAHRTLKDILSLAPPLDSIWVDQHDSLREVDVRWSEQAAYYGYYDHTRHCWVNVPEKELAQYRINIHALMRALQKSVHIQSPMQTYVPNNLWYLGQVRGQKRTIPLFFAKNLYAESVMPEVCKALKCSPLKDGVILTTQRKILAGDALYSHKVVTLHNLTSITDKGLTLNLRKMEALFTCHAAQEI